jgi:hypothetical protein
MNMLRKNKLWLVLALGICTPSLGEAQSETKTMDCDEAIKLCLIQCQQSSDTTCMEKCVLEKTGDKYCYPY